MLAIKGQEKILSRMILIKMLLAVVANVNLVGGCRTAVSGFFEDSNVTQFSEKLDSKIHSLWFRYESLLSMGYCK
jgi:hypothetical protein